MDDRTSDPLSDSSLQREIEAALDADPSPEFLARVRTRIRNEHAASPWRPSFVRLGHGAGGWQLLAAGAAVAIIAIAVTVSMRPAQDSPVQQDVLVPAGETAGDSTRRAEEASDRRAGPPDASARIEVPRPARRITPRSQVARALDDEARSFPEVLISPDEQHAFEFLAAIAREGRLAELPPVDLVALAEPRPPGDLEIFPITGITPLRIEPLPQIARLEIGGRP